MAKTNIQQLKELRKKEEGVITALEKQISDNASEIKELREADTDDNSDEWEPDHVIECGIGTIKYETTGSLDLVHLMEVVARLIQEQGPTELLRHLEGTFAV